MRGMCGGESMWCRAALNRRTLRRTACGARALLVVVVAVAAAAMSTVVVRDWTHMDYPPR